MEATPVRVEYMPALKGTLPALGHSLSIGKDPLAFMSRAGETADCVPIKVGLQRVYLISAPQLVREVLIHKAKYFKKGSMFEKLRDLLGDGLVTVNEPLHKPRRRYLQPTFSATQINAHSRSMAAVANARAAEWPADGYIDVNSEMFSIALKVACDTLLEGRSPGLNDIMSMHLPTFLRGVIKKSVLPEFYFRIPTPGNREMRASVETLRKSLLAAFEDMEPQIAHQGGFLAALMGPVFSSDEAIDEFITFMVASVETTAAAMSWALFHIATDPQLQARTIDEIESILEHGETMVTPQHISNLPYTRGVILEALRLYAMPFLMRTALNAVRIGNYLFPAGAEVWFSPYAIHRNSSHYDEAAKFRPERWESDPIDAKRDGLLLSFGAGSRQCIGEGYTMLEMFTVLVAVLRKWRLSLPAGHPPVKQTVRGTVHPSKLHVKVQARW